MPTNFRGERPPADSIFTFLRNGPSTKEMNQNGSVTPVDFKYTAPEGKRAVIERLNVEIMDNGIKMDLFGAIAALTGGLEIGVYDEQDQLLLDPTDGHPLTRNGNWSFLAGVDARIYAGAGLDIMNVRWTISRAGAPWRLDPGHYIRFRVQDDLTAISEFHVMVQGQLYTLGEQ